MAPDERPKAYVHRNVPAAVIALEMCVMQLVEEVPFTREGEAVVSEPRADGAVEHAREHNDWVASGKNGDQASRVVHKTLKGVHTRAAEGGGVVGFVVQ